MRSDIRNIRYLAKHGAFGNFDAIGFWVYGKRRDGRTVPCKNETHADGGITIFSEYYTSGDFMEEDVTEFTADEWSSIKRADADLTPVICNRILDARSKSK